MLHIVTLNLRLLSENQGQAKDAFETIPKREPRTFVHGNLWRSLYFGFDENK